MRNLVLYIRKKIPNKVISVAGINIEVEQEIFIKTIQLNLGTPGEEQLGIPQLLLEYEILFSKDGNPVTGLKDKIKPKVFTNRDKLLQRSFEADTFFQPIPNPTYDPNKPLGEDNLEFLEMGAIDFILGEIIMKSDRIQYLIPFLELYIEDNYNDGWYDTLS